jgi:hypothetical protein
MKQAMLALGDMLSEALERGMGSDVRFALVIWRDGDSVPMFSVSSELRLEIYREMLIAAASDVSEAEAELSGQVGHA